MSDDKSVKTRKSNSFASQEIKELVAKLIDLNVDKQVLALATGRTPQSIMNWHADVHAGTKKRRPGRPRKDEQRAAA